MWLFLKSAIQFFLAQAIDHKKVMQGLKGRINFMLHSSPR